MVFILVITICLRRKRRNVELIYSKDEKKVFISNRCDIFPFSRIKTNEDQTQKE